MRKSFRKKSNKFIKSVGKTAEKGVSKIYSSMSSIFDMGIKGANKFIKTQKRHRRRHR
jgi:ferritin